MYKWIVKLSNMCYNNHMLYFDNASTTKISKKSLESYIKASEDYFNPSSLYQPSVDVKKQIEDCREYFLKKFNAKPKSTFIFTGSATESNNAVLNAMITRKDKKYLISSGEHSSVYETAKKLKENGYNIIFVPLNKNGSVDIDKLIESVDENVAFISIIHVSNETGAINDIESIVKRAKQINPNISIHSDGVQAVGKLNIDLTKLGVDFYTISAHKIHGPKGIGGLFISNVNKFKPFILGGGQEMNLRSGTENTPAILAFKTALENIKQIDYSKHKKAILDNINVDYYLVSDDSCVDNIISICFKGLRGETIEHIMETKGYLIGTGSACNSKAGHNRVLSTIVKPDYLQGAIRISFDSEISVENCVEMAKSINATINELKKRLNK